MTVEPYTYTPTVQDDAIYSQVLSWSPDTFPDPYMLPKLGVIVRDGDELICFLCADFSDSVPRAFIDYLQTNPAVSPRKRHRAVVMAERFLVDQLQERNCREIVGISVHAGVASLSLAMGYHVHEKAALVFTKEIPTMESLESRPSEAIGKDHGINRLEEELVKHPPAQTPVVHRFTPGLYIRETHIPKGTIGTSMVHRFEHPFVISKGRIRVTSDNEGSVTYEAPYCGITLPGTRRAVFAEEDTIWTTFHVTDLTDIEAIAAELLMPPDNPLLDSSDPVLDHWKRGELSQPLPLPSA